MSPSERSVAAYHTWEGATTRARGILPPKPRPRGMRLETSRRQRSLHPRTPVVGGKVVRAYWLLVMAACGGDPSEAKAPDAGTFRESVPTIAPGSGDTKPITVVGRTEPAEADAGPSEAGGLVINEVDYDQLGPDNGEFVELYNTSASPVDASALALLLVNEDGVYRRIGLRDVIEPGGYLVVASAQVKVAPQAHVIEFASPTNNIRNAGSNAIGLLEISTHRLIDAVTYGEPLAPMDMDGHTLDFVEGKPNESADSNEKEGALARLPNGSDSNHAAKDWYVAQPPTPGEANIP